MKKFIKGQEVVKAKRYSEDTYCSCGGSEKVVPIGTNGVINSVNGDEARVSFSNGQVWNLNISELVSYKEWNSETDKKNFKLNFKPGTSIKEYVKKLIGMEKNKDTLKWLRTFDNCVLPEKVKNTIDEALTIVLRSDIFEKWGINEHFEKGLTNSILIYGPPGTGKTMVSESIAAVLGKNLLKLDNAVLQSSMPGAMERNISKAFEQAKNDNCIIMIDECDSLLYDRNAVGAIMGGHINHLLSELERFNGIVLLTTNRLHRLDEALQRRIIAKIELPLPDRKARENIWEKLVPPKMPIKNVDYNELSEVELSGGEIKNAIILAARKAIAQNLDKVEMHHFQAAIIGIMESKNQFEEVQPRMVREEIDRGSE